MTYPAPMLVENALFFEANVGDNEVLMIEALHYSQKELVLNSFLKLKKLCLFSKK